MQSKLNERTIPVKKAVVEFEVAAVSVLFIALFREIPESVLVLSGVREIVFFS
jgi:hypothetical protein